MQIPADLLTTPTPFYLYDLALLRRTLDAARAAASAHDIHVHYALKANANPPILELVREHGFGADCVSGNEVQRALDCGFPSQEIVFAGVGKSDAEIDLALRADIWCFNVESAGELRVIDELATRANRRARVALRLNPDVDARTHRYITTGTAANKFGISVDDLPQVLELLGSLANLELVGIHVHIGSQITDLSVFATLCRRINELQQWFADRGIPLPHLNLGGGLGVDYNDPDAHPIPDFAGYFETLGTTLQRRPDQQVHVELGRALVAQCGTLVSRVLFVKESGGTRFAVLDAGMTELIRPALYQSVHRIENVTSSGPQQVYDVVGPVCETSDTFARGVALPETRRGDIVVLRTTGAYGEVMSSHYNLRSKAEAVYV